MVITAVIGLVAITVAFPRLTGTVPYTILTGSMEPTMPPGTLVIVKRADPDEIGVGTVITYQITSGKPAVVTHRVVSQGFDGDGKPVFRTRGDANTAVDQDVVRPVQIKGKVWFSVPYVGYANTLLTGSQHQVVLVVAVTGLLLYAASMFFSGAWNRHRTRTAIPNHSPESAEPNSSEGPREC
jgi:signal peptidase